MANELPATLADLTFDAVDVQRSDLSLHLDVVSGLTDGLEVRGEDTVIPGLAGRSARSRVGDVRNILLAGFLQGTGTTEATRLAHAQNTRDLVESLFDPRGDPATLVGRAADGTWREISARTVLVAFNPWPIPGAGELSVSLVSVDPDWVVTGGGS